MEADWEFEVGGDSAAPAAPVIDAHWPGFIDLQRFPERAWALSEAVHMPALAEALIRLNAVESAVCTSKCDVWTIADTGDFDPDELDAPTGTATHAMGCYIDLLPKNDQQWRMHVDVAAVCKQICVVLRDISIRCCRVDLVIRKANLRPDALDFAVTAYLISCGASESEATRNLEAALAAFADALSGHSTVE